jgi:hypothetical protein
MPLVGSLIFLQKLEPDLGFLMVSMAWMVVCNPVVAVMEVASLVEKHEIAPSSMRPEGNLDVGLQLSASASSGVLP